MTASTEDDLLHAVAVHARDAHGMTNVPAEVIAAVRAHIVSVD